MDLTQARLTAFQLNCQREPIDAVAGLHIIIFDEIDAICKARGSSGGESSGVNDTVVNQLLSKIDGVDQLNNILVIGMTNRYIHQNNSVNDDK